MCIPRERFFLPPKKFGKRSVVFQILMPIAPTRIKPRLRATPLHSRLEKPGVLLPSQPRHRRQPTPAPTTSRHITRQPRPPEQHFHPPDSRHTRRFHPPETKPPSQYRQNAPITTTIPTSGGRNRTRRAKTSPKRRRA